MDESPFPRASEMHTNRRPKALFILIAFLIILFLLIFAATRFLGTGTDDESAESDMPPTPVIEPTATASSDDTKQQEGTDDQTSPTPQEQEEEDELDRSSLSIQVLNGSGVSGVAGRMQGILEEAGYTDITAGNADSFDYEDVSISVKKTKANFLELLKTDLEDSYTIGDTDTNLSSGSYDAVIIIGG